MSELSSELSIVLLVFLLLCCSFAVVCTVYVRRLANYCRDSVNYVLSQNKNAVTLRKMADIETAVTDLTDAYDSLITQHKRLRARIGMRENRAAKQNPVESTDDKTQLRLAAKQNGYLR